MTRHRSPTSQAARERLAGQIVATPCLPSRTLSEITGAELWLKFENLQYTASFKERGALNRLAQLTPEQAAAGVIAMSAGNHAQGVAYHARRLGIPATIVMPPPHAVREGREHAPVRRPRAARGRGRRGGGAATPGRSRRATA